jgi:Spy/CpxP family protein refolding chaperone
MSWIKLAVAGIALCAGASVASAQGAPPAAAPQGAPQGPQGGPPPGGARGRGMQMLFEGITLTEAQQKQVQDISEKYRAQMRELMPNGMQGGPPDDATRAKMDDIRGKQNAEIRALLTADQQTIFDKNVVEAKKRREQMGNRPPGGRGR